MIILLLCIMFSETLNFDGLTVPVIYNWFSNHPFIFLFLLGEILKFNMDVNIKK